MASVASQLIEEVTAHAQSDTVEDAREICADGIYFPNNLRILSVNFSTYFGWFLHPSSGTQITVFTASGTSQPLLLPDR